MSGEQRPNGHSNEGTLVDPDGPPRGAAAPSFSRNRPSEPTGGTPSDAVVQEALSELGQYLSDKLAPMMVADSLTVLTRVTSQRVAAEITAWATAQHAGGTCPLTDYYFHGLRKVQIVGEYRLVPSSLFEPFFKNLRAAVLESAPPSLREQLASDLARLSETRTVSVEQVEMLHRPEGAEDAPQGSTDTEAAPSGGMRLDLPAGLELTPQSLRRLEVLLSRLGQPTTSTTPARRDVLVAETFATVASGASSSHDMDAQLAEFRASGLAQNTYDLFRALGDNLPGWWAPGLAGPGEDNDLGLAAMEQMITLAEDRLEASRRFREMIENAIEQFNSGALGRAVRVFDLALNMIESGEVVAASVEALRERGHEALDPDRVADLLEEGNPQGFPRVMLRFFHAFAPERLLDELRQEERRERRMTLVSLIATQGDDGREAVFDRLVHRPEALSDVYVLRNLIHLMRRIPRSVNTTWSQQHEIGRIIRFLVPESPPLVIQEILDYLASANDPVANQALQSFMVGLEAVAASTDISDDRRADVHLCLDATSEALADSDDPRAWAALVAHAEGYSSAAARCLTALGRRDLSRAPGLVNRLMEPAVEEMGQSGQEEGSLNLETALMGIISALASTPTPEVQAFLETVTNRFPGSEVGEEAARLLRSLHAREAHGVALEGGLNGDLDLFGLPALLQMLGDVKSTGILTLTDSDSEQSARFAINRGLVIEAQAGNLTDRDAVWQLLERPFAGRFAFVPQEPATSSDPGESLDVTALLLEGMQRHDELRLAEALVPGDVALVARVPGWPHVPGEDDEELLGQVWTALIAGRTVNECEQALTFDAFRVWRPVARWIEAGALEPVTNHAGDES